MTMTTTVIRHLIAFFFFAFVCNIGFADSGIYKNILIGVNPQTGVITGAFHDERNPPIGPSFSCVFAIKGNKNEGAINVGFPGDAKLTKGEIKFQENKEGKQIFLKLTEQQPGCSQTTAFDFLQGDVLDFTKAKPWISVMVVVSKKAHFYDAPDLKKKRRGYVVYADSVGILESVDNWVKVEYVNENHSIVGWLRLQDVGSL